MKYLMLFISLSSLANCSQNESKNKSIRTNQNQSETINNSIPSDTNIRLLPINEGMQTTTPNDTIIISPNSAPEQKLIDSIKALKTIQKQKK